MDEHWDTGTRGKFDSNFLNLEIPNMFKQLSKCLVPFKVHSAEKSRDSISSDELALKLGITRGTVVHHLNKLMEAGLVVHQGKGYMLRVENLSELINELERDVNRICHDLKIIAADVDKKMSL